MGMIVDEGIYTRYLKRSNRYSSIVTALAVLFTLSGFFLLLIVAGNNTPSTAHVLYLSALGVGVFVILDTVRRARTGPVPVDTRYPTAWTLLGLGGLASIPGGTIVALVHEAEIISPGLTYLTLVSFLYYPLLFVGLLFISGAARWRMSIVFDALLTTICIICVCWFVIWFVSEGSSAGPLHLLENALFLSYPFNDLFLIVVLLPLVRQEKEARNRIPLYLMLGSFLANLWAHSAIAYIRLVGGEYQPGTVYIDWFWQISFLLLALAVLSHYMLLLRRVANEQDRLAKQVTGGTPPEGMAFRRDAVLPRGWRFIQTVYIPLALALSIFILVTAARTNEQISGFMIFCALAVVLINVRYWYSSRQNDRLLHEKEQQYREAEHVRYLVAQLSDIRDLELLRERIVGVILNELGFTFAMLLLVEEYDGELTSQSRLLVSMASKSAHLTKWRLRADRTNILFRTATSGKRAEINWVHYNLPAEIRSWQDRQHVPPMIFFPMTYRDKVLGSLGVARHALTQPTQAELTIIRLYTEQIAAILEHAYLYREAREREAFARAMANIATRLNAVVVDLREISQLICEEGANALRADYVVLYLAQENGQFRPLSTSTGIDRSLSSPQHWPAFSMAEYEEEISHSLHPFLLDITQRRKMGSMVVEQVFGADIPPVEPAREAFGPRLLPLRARLARHFIQTVILAPLVAGGQLMGVLLFARATPPGTSNELSFDNADLHHAQDFAEQAAVAFANARLYEDLRETHKRLQELDQLKDQFMITASHELRTPLTAVQGYIELMAQYDEVLPPEQRREFLQKAQLGCEELAILLRNVMDASRLEAEAGIKPALISRVAVLDIIEKVKVMVEPLVTHEQRSVYVDVPPYLSVYADPLRLHQVLLNISSNALKYSVAGTPISFSARISADQGRFVTISVTDKGKGIAPEDQAQLFQRFVRLESDLNSPVRGSGLGLYISRRLIEAMGGKIWVESRGVLGEGSTFHVQLPMA